jgi:glycosyltransferase involved in cell wall biosynthesis
MRLVAVSHDLASFLAHRMRLDRSALTVVHNGVPVPVREARNQRERSVLRSALGLPREGSLLVAVGNLYAVKDHATLLRALARLDDAHLAIAGRGEEEEPLRALARDLDLADRLHLLGLRDDVDRLLAAADVFVQPSRSEGLPLALLEAMAAGLPVVATRVGGLPEAVVPGECGELVPAADPEALAVVLRSLLADPKRAAELGGAARRRVCNRFSVDAMVDAYRALYAQARPPVLRHVAGRDPR